MKFWHILVGLVAILVILYLHSVFSVKLENVGVNNVEDISLRGFTLNGFVELANNGFLPVKIKRVDYQLLMEKSNLILTNGTINSINLPARKLTNIPLTSKINWLPTGEFALDLLRGKAVFGVLKGQVVFAFFKLPFENRVNLTSELGKLGK